MPAPPPPPAPDIEAQLTEAYHRGVQEGLDAGKSEAATARALERAELQKRARVASRPPQIPQRGYAKLFAEQILGADEGCYFGFLR